MWSSYYLEVPGIQGDGAGICWFAHYHINTPGKGKREVSRRDRNITLKVSISNTSVLKRLELHSKQEKWKSMKNLPLEPYTTPKMQVFLIH